MRIKAEVFYFDNVKNNWGTSTYKCVLEKKQFSKKHFEKYFFSRAHLQALELHSFYDIIKI